MVLRRWGVALAGLAAAAAVVGSVGVVGSLAVAAAAWIAGAAAWWGPARWGVVDRASRWLARGGTGLLAVAWSGIAVASGGPQPGLPPHPVFSPLALAGIVLLVGAVLRWVALRSQGGVLDGWLEGLLVAAALAVLVAEVLFSPYLGVAGLDVDPLSGAAIPLVMAVTVGVAVRLLLAGAERLPAAWLLLAAAVASLFADTLYSAAGETADAVVLAGWAAAYLLVAAALAHPSIGALVRRGGEPPAGVSSPRPWAQLGFIAAALLIPAALRANQTAATSGTPVPSIVASMLLLLVLWRLARLLRGQSEDARRLQRRAAELRRHAEHQAALAALSRASLHSDTPEELLHRTAATVADTLEVPCHPLVDIDGRADRGEPAGTDGLWPIDDGHALVCDHPTDRPLDASDEAFLEAAAAVAAAGLGRLGTEAALRHDALHDSLTGLANRTLIGDRLAHALAAAARDDTLTGVVFVDLDGFKAINDTYGHAAGDAVLTAVAEALAAVVRRGDTLGRISGDEFVVIAPQVTAEGLDDLAGRALDAVARAGQRLPAHAAGARVTASIGTALGHHTTSPDRLLSNADTAMYEVKHHGGADHSPTPCYHTPHQIVEG